MRAIKIIEIQEIQENLLPQDDCMKLLNVSRQTLYNYKATGVLIPIKLGGKVRYRLSDINNFLKGGNQS